MKDLSGLPTGDASEGNKPDAEPYYSHLLAEAWAATLPPDGKDMAFPEARLRHSWAGMCARRIGYEITGAEVTEPIDVADRWRFGLGTIVHERWQEVLQKAFPNAEVEKKVFIDECKSAGHIDLFVEGTHTTEAQREDPWRTSLELKTINGFGFKMAIGARGPAEGPRTGAMLQAAMNGKASDADDIVLVYLSTENLSPRELDKLCDRRYGGGGKPYPWRKFAAEWKLGREQYEPMANAEVARFKKILDVVDEGTLPPRAIPLELPKGARIVDPSKGTWHVEQDGMIVDTGSFWGCSYCPYQSRCTADMPN